jgi:hypothetical protein
VTVTPSQWQMAADSDSDSSDSESDSLLKWTQRRHATAAVPGFGQRRLLGSIIMMIGRIPVPGRRVHSGTPGGAEPAGRQRAARGGPASLAAKELP